MKIVKQIVPESKYNIKCPYEMKPTRIVVHNTANDATARNEIAYMTNNNYEVSFHYAVDDKEIVQGIEENRNAWHSGDGHGKGNREGIAIEICYSKSGGDRFIKAEQNAVELIVDILKRYNWGIDKVTKHQDYSNKYCPHRTLDMGWNRFIKMIEDKLNVSNSKPEKINVTYQAYDNQLKKYWSEITNYNNVNANGYAGCMGHSIGGIRVKASKGIITIQSHIKGGKWLSPISKWDNTANGYSGIYGKDIDMVMIKSSVGTVRYRVHTKNGKWLGWITKWNINDSVNGMAGIYGKSIDAIQIEII